MQPMWAALETLGLSRARRFGASGNFLFDTPARHTASLEERIGEELGTDAFVRTREEFAGIVEGDPYAGKVAAN